MSFNKKWSLRILIIFAFLLPLLLPGKPVQAAEKAYHCGEVPRLRNSESGAQKIGSKYYYCTVSFIFLA